MLSPFERRFVATVNVIARAFIPCCLGAAVAFGIAEHRITADHAQIARNEAALASLLAQNMRLHDQVMESVESTVALRGTVESKMDDAATAASAAITATERLNVCEAAARELQTQQQTEGAAHPVNPAIVALLKAFLR